MFQIVSALALEVPAFLQNIEKLRGVSPDVQLLCEPWGHADHNGGESLSGQELEDVSVSTKPLHGLARPARAPAAAAGLN